MIKLIDILNEITISKPGKTVYAISDYEGSFIELKLINNSDIIEDNGKEDNDGVYMFKYKQSVEEYGDEYDYYLAKIKI